jgi:tetratricopeptide (TPR) repeat protein
MTIQEARQILGLGPDEDPRPHVPEFRNVRERLAEMVRTAPTETMAERYQQSLQDFDRALAAVREHLEDRGLVMAAAPSAARPAAPDDGPEPQERGSRMLLVGWCLILLGMAAAAWYYLKRQDDLRMEQMVAVARLERQGAAYIEERRWPEAVAAFAEIERLSPESPAVLLGRRGIEAGMAEEQAQFGGYWLGQARTALEAGGWDEAEAAVRQVLERFPTDEEGAALLGEIATARAGAALQAAAARAKEALARHEWDAAIVTANSILDSRPGDSDAAAVIAEAIAAKEQAAADLARARALYEQALARDTGKFDQTGLDWLREAALLAPTDPEILGLYEKFASYTRTLRVPEDFPTPAAALAAARARDRIIVAEGVWEGPLTVEAPVEIQGAGSEQTRIECPAEAGNVITLGPEAIGCRLTGLSFRHQSQTGEAERFAAGLVRGGTAELADCRFIAACGHGLAVIEGGTVRAVRCRFTDNGWNGASAMGAGSTLDLRDSIFAGNFENGAEAWDGAALTAVNNRCEGNSRNGIHADTGAAAAVIEGNQLLANREFGLVLSTATAGRVSGNTATRNMLGGMAVRAAVTIPVTHNQIIRNTGPGLVLELGLGPAVTADNTTTGNTGQQVLPGLKFEAAADKQPSSAVPR